MSLSLRRGALATAAVLAFVPLAAGCGASFNAGSEQVVPDNTDARIGALSLLDIDVVIDPSTDRGLVTGTVVNDGRGADQLQQLSAAGHQAQLAQGSGTSASGAASLTAAATVTSLPIPAGDTLRLGSTGMAMATVPSTGLTPGSYVPVVFQFADAGTTTVQALVEPDNGIYAGITPAPTPTATPCPTPTSTATPTSTSTPTSKATATSTATSTSTPTTAACVSPTSTPTGTATATATSSPNS